MRKRVCILCFALVLLFSVSSIAFSEESTGLELILCELSDNGWVRVSWQDPDRNGPYSLSYMVSVSDDPDDPAQRQRLRWIAGTSISSRSHIFQDPIPGVKYWFILSDSAGNTVMKQMTPGKKQPFPEFETVRLYARCRVLHNERTDAVDFFSAAALSSGNEDDCYGLYLRLAHDQVGHNEDYNGLVAIYDPNGYPMTTDVDVWEIRRNVNETVNEFLDLTWYWEKLTLEYGFVPQGTYTVELYLDSTFTASGTFEVKN